MGISNDIKGKMLIKIMSVAYINLTNYCQRLLKELFFFKQLTTINGHNYVKSLQDSGRHIRDIVIL